MLASGLDVRRRARRGMRRRQPIRRSGSASLAGSRRSRCSWSLQRKSRPSTRTKTTANQKRAVRRRRHRGTLTWRSPAHGSLIDSDAQQDCGAREMSTRPSLGESRCADNLLGSSAAESRGRGTFACLELRPGLGSGARTRICTCSSRPLTMTVHSGGGQRWWKVTILILSAVRAASASGNPPRPWPHRLHQSAPAAQLKLAGVS
jgi:hypothetical protein